MRRGPELSASRCGKLAGFITKRSFFLEIEPQGFPRDEPHPSLARGPAIQGRYSADNPHDFVLVLRHGVQTMSLQETADRAPLAVVAQPGLPLETVAIIVTWPRCFRYGPR
jgi:hypothetical protein